MRREPSKRSRTPKRGGRTVAHLLSLANALDSGRIVVFEADAASDRIRYIADPEHLSGRSYRAPFLPETITRWLAMLHPEDRPRVEAALHRSLTDGEDFDEEYRVQVPDPAMPTRWIETRGSVQPDGQARPRLSGISLDITDHRLLEAALRQRESTLQAIFEASPDVINILGADGRIRVASPAVRSVLGFDLEHWDGADPLRAIHPDDRERVADVLERMFAGRAEVNRMRVRHRRADGSFVVLEAAGRRIADHLGTTTGLVVISRDVSEQVRLEQELRDARDGLEEKVRERTHELECTQLEVLERLALAAEFRDDDTGQHTRRVGEGAARVAAVIGLPAGDVELMRRAAPLHDVGKIGVPDHVFLKAGRMTPEEKALMRTHTTIGASILSGGQYPLLKLAEQVALTHHERWDGQGYPRGLRGDEIPLIGRVTAIADVFDALTHTRPYKPAWTEEEALAEIERLRGQHFDPEVVDAFLATRTSPPTPEPRPPAKPGEPQSRSSVCS